MRTQLVLAVVPMLTMFACGSETSGAPVPPAEASSSAGSSGDGARDQARNPAPVTVAKQSPAGPGPRIVVFRGACDASGAVVLGEWLFAVADDEDNVLRVYDGRTGGEAVQAVDVSPALRLEKPRQETDIEAGTRTGDLALWITSHGRNKKGKKKSARFRLFATTVPSDGLDMKPVGEPYLRLVEDLLEVPALERFDLEEAETKPPKEPGGLAIEGLTERPERGDVLIGFRNPVPEERALLIPLGNPTEVIRGARPRFGEPILLDLGGLGVRSLSWWRGTYLVVGGPVDEGRSRLFEWDGKSAKPRPVDVPGLEDLNPEAFVTYEDKDEFLVLSDDGTMEIDGKPCKKHKDPARKHFRGMWIKLPR